MIDRMFSRALLKVKSAPITRVSQADRGQNVTNYRTEGRKAVNYVRGD